MKRLVIAAVLAPLALTALFTGTAEAKSDSCRSGGQRAVCRVDVSARMVNHGKVIVGRRTAANWAIRCSKGNRRYTDRGRVGRGSTDRINVRYQNASCSLAAAGSGRGRVKVRVVLR